VLSLALKLASSTGLSVESILHVGHIGLGAAAVYAFVCLAQLLIDGTAIRRTAIAFFVCHPVFYLTLHQYFYTFHEVALLLLAMLALARLLERPALSRLVLFAGVVSLIVLTRSLFHWLFGLAAIGLLAARCPGSIPARPRLAIFGLAASLLLAWPTKNALEFGFFGYSSWRGFNLQRGLPVEAGDFAKLGKVPSRYAEVPVLSRSRKADGSANWNFYPLIARSQQLEQRAVALMRSRPEVVLDKALENYWSLTRFSGRQPFTADYGNDVAAPPAVVPWMKFYEWLLYQDFRGTASLARGEQYGMVPDERWRLSGFTLLFPVVLVACAFAAHRSRSRDPHRAVLVAAMLACIAWVTAMVLFVDGTEGNRIRFSTEPFLLLLLGWLVGSRGSRRGTGAPESAG
jgi:hypothetical protein